MEDEEEEGRGVNSLPYAEQIRIETAIDTLVLALIERRFDYGTHGEDSPIPREIQLKMGFIRKELEELCY